jgi:hypothetical protein
MTRQHWDVFRQDLHLALRLLARNPGFAAAAILTLALGIGGSTTIFSVVYAIIFRPLAFPESERVLRIGWLPHGEDRNRRIDPLSYGNIQTLREKAGAYDLIGGIRYDSLSFDRKPLQAPAGVPAAAANHRSRHGVGAVGPGTRTAFDRGRSDRARIDDSRNLSCGFGR